MCPVDLLKGLFKETWSEAQQERLELQRARVLEVNRHLAALTESWERGGLPLHMNLAVHHYPPPQDLTDRLKQQNRMLNEVTNQFEYSFYFFKSIDFLRLNH